MELKEGQKYRITPTEEYKKRSNRNLEVLSGTIVEVEYVPREVDIEIIKGTSIRVGERKLRAGWFLTKHWIWELIECPQNKSL